MASESVRIVIVGGVAAGMSAATRARRMNERASITVFERGGYLSFANCGLPYYIAGRITQESKLLVAPAAMIRDRFNIDARVGHEVQQIDRNRTVVRVVERATGQTFEQPYDKLILAPGADAIVPPIEHVRASNVFALRSMEDTQAIYEWLAWRASHRAVIVGAGFIGLEMAESLRARDLEVTVIEKVPHVLPVLDSEMTGWIERELARNQVRLITGAGLKSLRASDGLVSGVESDDGQVVETDMVLMSIGVRPNVALARDAGLTIGASGAIAVDAYQRTNDPDIYAAGDVAEVIHAVTDQPCRIPLAGPANRQGRTAGEHAATGRATPAGKVLGTAIVKVFEIAAGATGLSEAAAGKEGLAVDTAYAIGGHHAGYYPGAQQIRIKLVYEKRTGRVLGGQVVGGPDGVDKRLDVLATAIQFKATVDDLTQVDLAYAPQFGSAKDPLHMAAFVAQNQLSGLTPALTPQEVEDELLLDVRTAQEFAAGALKGAVNFPVDELRKRLGELDRGRPIVVYCGVGQRGHVATRILRQHGFNNVKNLKGGYALATSAPLALGSTPDGG